MAIWVGSFKGNYPCITMQVTGTQGHPAEITAVVDTGFTGFLLLSAERAAPLGLEPLATTTATLADGNVQNMQTAFANVGFADRTERGVATLAPQRVASLVGIDFLRKFKMALSVTATEVYLLDGSDLVRMQGLSGKRACA